MAEYVVAGATGHVGSAVAQALLDSGRKVRVIARDPHKAERWKKRGAHVGAGPTRCTTPRRWKSSTQPRARVPSRDCTSCHCPSEASTRASVPSGTEATARVPCTVAISATAGSATSPWSSRPLTGLVPRADVRELPPAGPDCGDGTDPRTDHHGSHHH